MMKTNEFIYVHGRLLGSRNKLLKSEKSSISVACNNFYYVLEGMAPYSMLLHIFLAVSHVKHRSFFLHLRNENLSLIILTNNERI